MNMTSYMNYILEELNNQDVNAVGIADAHVKFWCGENSTDAGTFKIQGQCRLVITSEIGYGLWFSNIDNLVKWIHNRYQLRPAPLTAHGTYTLFDTDDWHDLKIAEDGCEYHSWRFDKAMMYDDGLILFVHKGKVIKSMMITQINGPGDNGKPLRKIFDRKLYFDE